MHKQVSLCLSFKRQTNNCLLWLKLCDVWEGFNCCRGVQGGLIKKQVKCDVHEWAASVILSHPCAHLPFGYCDILLKPTVKLFIIAANAQWVQPRNKTDTHTHAHTHTHTNTHNFVWFVCRRPGFRRCRGLAFALSAVDRLVGTAAEQHLSNLFLSSISCSISLPLPSAHGA